MVTKKQKAWDEAEELGLTKDLVYEETTEKQIREIIDAFKSEPEEEPEEEPEQETPEEEEPDEEQDEEEEPEEEPEEEEDVDVEFIDEPEEEEEKEPEEEKLVPSKRPVSNVHIVKNSTRKKPLKKRFPKSKLLSKY